MDAFLEQLQREQRGKAREKDPGLHFYSNDVAIGDSNPDWQSTPTSKITLLGHTITVL
ncbi:hypothetical protein OROMI_006632 [Orobanche minor]